VGQRHPQRQPHRAAAIRRQCRGLRQLWPQPRAQPFLRRPEVQGLGFGRRLFTAARRDLAQSGLKSLVVWALSENENAVEFYRALGGKAVARSSEKFGTRVLDKVAFAWQN
jgi:GNAT superfamily N-acetyltransferase